MSNDSGPSRRASRPRPSIIDFIATADEDEPLTISPGSYKYPFEYQLPASLPASFQGRWGQVAYSARLSLERGGWVLGELEREQEFSVRACYDLNEEPELVVSDCQRTGAVMYSFCYGKRILIIY